MDVIHLGHNSVFRYKYGDETYTTSVPIPELEMDVDIAFNPSSSLYNSDNYDEDSFCPMCWCMWTVYWWSEYKALKKLRMREYGHR